MHSVVALGQVVIEPERQVLIAVAEDVDKVLNDGVLREVDLAQFFDIDELLGGPRVSR